MSIASSVLNAPRTVWMFIKEARAELSKVTWPDRETIIQYTIIVVAASVVVGLIIGGIDYVLAWIAEQLIT